jgi:hypothetical protein
MPSPHTPRDTGAEGIYGPGQLVLDILIGEMDGGVVLDEGGMVIAIEQGWCHFKPGSNRSMQHSKIRIIYRIVIISIAIRPEHNLFDRGSSSEAASPAQEQSWFRCALQA